MAMPRYEPSEEQRRVVKTMAAYGIPQDAIAKVVQCSEPTLRRAYRHELDTAVHEANARVAQCLYQQATTPGNVAASIFWLKARAGWREKQAVEIQGQAAVRVEVVDIVTGVPRSAGAITSRTLIGRSEA